MDYLKYQKKINDVITKCPLEVGIEILVYNLLDECVDTEKYAVVDISQLRKDKDPRLQTTAGISDIAILSPDFEYRELKKGKVYGFVEVKAAGCSLKDGDQIKGQMENVPHYIYTNGITWQ